MTPSPADALRRQLRERKRQVRHWKRATGVLLVLQVLGWAAWAVWVEHAGAWLP